MRYLLLTAFLAAGSATAQCPTRADMAGGASAVVEYPDASHVELKWLGEGMVQETTRFPEGEGEFRMISMGGVFIIDEVDMAGEAEVPSSRITSRYPEDISGHLPLRPSREFGVTAVNSFADGSEPEEERISVKTGETAEIQIAGCRYRGFPMLLTYHWAEKEFTSMMTHLPDLGLSLELARMDQDQDPEPFAPVRFDLRRP